MDMITVTDTAAVEMRKLIARHEMPDGTTIRIGIKGGGCSGYSYVFDFETVPPTARDLVVEKEGVRVVVDKKSALFLAGTEIDYESSPVKAGFIFKNPRAKTTCGCGTSFSI